MILYAPKSRTTQSSLSNTTTPKRAYLSGLESPKENVASAHFGASPTWSSDFRDGLGSLWLVVLEAELALLFVGDGYRDDGDDDEEFVDVDVNKLESDGDADAYAEDEDEGDVEDVGDGDEMDDSSNACAPVGMGVPFLPACRG